MVKLGLCIEGRKIRSAVAMHYQKGKAALEGGNNELDSIYNKIIIHSISSRELN